MSSVNWNLVCGLLAFIVVCLLVRSDTKRRMSDRPWLRTYRRPTRVRNPHHTTIRRDTQDYWECGMGRVRNP